MTDMVWKGADDLRALLRPVGDFFEDPQNARVHNERNLDAIARSFATFGQQKPIVYEEAEHPMSGGPAGKVIAGNGSIIVVARRLGWTHIAAVRYGGTDAPADGFAIADNRSAELGEWDLAKLAEGLQSLDGALDLADVGFTKFEVDTLLNSLGGEGGSEPPEGVDDPNLPTPLETFPEDGDDTQTASRGRVILVYQSVEEREWIEEVLGGPVTKVVYPVKELLEEEE